MHIPLGEVVHFTVVTGNSNSEWACDAPSAAPDVRIYEEDNDTPILGPTAMTNRGITGVYRGTFTASSGNGFEVGKWYTVTAEYADASANNICKVVMIFRVVSAEVENGIPVVDTWVWKGQIVPDPSVTGVPKVDPWYWRGGTISAPATSGLPDVNVSKAGNTDWGSGAITAASIATGAVGEIVAGDYEGGAVWIDTVNGTAGTTSYVDGTKHDPCSTLANALTIAGAVGLRRFRICPGSSITLASNYTGWVFTGDDYTLAFGSSVLTNVTIEGATVSGTFTGSPILSKCRIGNVTISPCIIKDSSFVGTVTIGATGFYVIEHGNDGDESSVTPVIDFGSGVGATNLSIREWQGGLGISNMLTGDTLSISGVGRLTIDSSCTGGTVLIRGIFDVENSGSGQSITQTAAYNMTNIRTAMGLASANLDTQIGTLATAANLATVAGYLDTEIAAILADTNELQTDWVNGGRLDLLIDAIKAKTDNLPSDPADASDIAASFSTVNTKLDTIDDFLDTEVAAIKVVTDSIGATGTGLTAIPWNASWDAEVQSEVQDALEVNNLDHLVKTAVDTDWATTVHLDSIMGHIAQDGIGTGGVFDRTSDSLEAIRNRGDIAWITATGFSTLTQADIRTAIGLASANLDTQLGTLATSSALATVAGYLDTEIAAILADTNELQTDWVNGGRLDLLIDAIKAKTDNLPADPADASDIASSFSTVNTKLDTIDDFLDTEIGTIVTAVGTSIPASITTLTGYVDTEVAAIKAKTDNLPADPADASDIAASFVTVNTKLDTIDDLVDTEVAAIKAKTDQLTFTVANQVDANTLSGGNSAASIRSAVGLASANIDTQFETALKLARADHYIDTSVTPWALVFMEAGTGGIGVGTELLRKRLYSTSGATLTSTDTVVGQAKQ